MGQGGVICCVINAICSTITVLMFVVSIPTLIVQFQEFGDRIAQGPFRHTVGDTRIISMDRSILAFCRGLKLTVNRDETAVTATLYALSTFPALDGRSELNHTLSIHGKDDYSYYYLHPGSNVTISACTFSTPYRFVIIRGRHNFELWQEGKSARVFTSFQVGSNAWCRGPSNNSTSFVVYQTTVPEEDDWYFAADAHEATANLSLQRYEYSVMNSSILSSCDAGGSNPDSCTVEKFNSATYLLKIGPRHSGSNVEASVACVVDGGAVAGVVLAVLFVLILSVIICIICCCCCYFVLRKRR